MPRRNCRPSSIAQTATACCSSSRPTLVPLGAEAARYDEWTRRRLLVRPGITGLWQTQGRSDLSWEDSVRLDLYYVENWSLTSDIIILYRTVRSVTRADGAY
jgi:lipopolysaccharide/colanic/teichoic acid biosynthesis glycosyltransferase